MATYKRLMLSMRYELLRLDTPSAYQREAVSLRERQVDEMLAVKRTPLSMLMLLVHQREELSKARGKMTIVLQWFDHCHWSRSTGTPSRPASKRADAFDMLARCRTTVWQRDTVPRHCADVLADDGSQTGKARQAALDLRKHS